MLPAQSLPVSASPPDPIPTAPDSGVRATASPEPTSDPARAEELRLVALAKAGDQRAVGALLRMHAGLIHATARVYFGNAGDADDVLQAARIGFMRGIEGYDASHGTKLWTYARDWVRLEARDALIASFPVIVPRYRHIEACALERRGKTSPLVRRLRRVLRMASMDAPRSGSDEWSSTLGETIPSADPLPDEGALLAIDGDRARALIDAAIASLAPRDGEIVRRRLLGGETLDAIGTSVGLTRERVRQIVESRKPKLRQHIATHTTADERDLLRGT